MDSITPIGMIIITFGGGWGIWWIYTEFFPYNNKILKIERSDIDLIPTTPAERRRSFVFLTLGLIILNIAFLCNINPTKENSVALTSRHSSASSPHQR